MLTVALALFYFETEIEKIISANLITLLIKFIELLPLLAACPDSYRELVGVGSDSYRNWGVPPQTPV